MTERSPIEQAMNTHGNGDHWFGNALLPDGIPIVATAAALDEMRAVGPQLVARALQQDATSARSSTPSPRDDAPLRLRGITPRLPTEPFDGRRDCRSAIAPSS